MKEPYINLEDYIRDQSEITDQEIRQLLFTKKFCILRNSNGHNYRRFVDSKGILRFNNPRLHLAFSGSNRTGGSINMGCIGDGNSGNHIRFHDIGLIIVEKSKKDIINRIQLLNKKKTDIEEKLNTYLEQLDFLINTNSDEFDQEEFDKWKKEKIKNELKDKKSEIAEMKV